MNQVSQSAKRSITFTRNIYFTKILQNFFFYIVSFNFRYVECSFYLLHNMTKKKFLLILRYPNITTTQYTRHGQCPLAFLIVNFHKIFHKYTSDITNFRHYKAYLVYLQGKAVVNSGYLIH